MYVKVESGVPGGPLTEYEVRALFQNTSFPAELPDLSASGVFALDMSAEPVYDLTKNVAQATPAFTNGAWCMTWSVTNASAEEITARQKARVPTSVTKRQGMAELIDEDLLDDVEAILNAIPGKAGLLARNDFYTSQEWQRDWPLIAQLKPALGWTDEFIDARFIAAKQR